MVLLFPQAFSELVDNTLSQFTARYGISAKTTQLIHACTCHIGSPTHTKAMARVADHRTYITQWIVLTRRS